MGDHSGPIRPMHDDDARSEPAELTLDAVDAWWRAANYLSVAQLHLLDDVLLRRPLRRQDVKRRPVGRWDAVPALNLVQAHANRLIVEHDLEALLVCGLGRAGQSMIANAWLEGTYSDLHPDVGLDEDGIAALCRRFAFPGGVGSRAAPSTPGAIDDGGEPGSSLEHAAGAVLDDPDLTAVCVIGDGETASAALASSRQVSRALHPRRDGAVLPVLTLDAGASADPALLSCRREPELRAVLAGAGWDPIIVEADAGDDHAAVHERVAAAFDEAQGRLRDPASDGAPRPMLVLRTPSDWTGPAGLAGAGGADDVSTGDPRLARLERWLRSYRPDELFDELGGPSAALDPVRPRPDRRMTASRRAHGGVRQDIRLPDAREHAIEVPPERNSHASATSTARRWLAHVARENPETFRLFVRGEAESDRLEAVVDASPRRGRIDGAERLAPPGRAIELTSGHVLQGLAEGYLLTGRHGVVTSSEAAGRTVDPMLDRLAAWIDRAADVPWRRELPAATHLLSSNARQHDRQGPSHRDPGFADVVADTRTDVARILLPPDANTLLATLERALPAIDVVNLVIAGEHDQPAWLSLDEARAHVEAGAGEWAWAGTDDAGDAPDVVLACAGDVPTIEAIAAAQLVARDAPWVEARVVNLVDLLRLPPPERHPRGLPDAEWDALFPPGVPVVMAFHGSPSLVHRLLHGRDDAQRFHVHGRREGGTTTTPFDMLMLDDLDRFALAADALRRATDDDGSGDHAIELWEAARRRNREHAREHGVDLPELEHWSFRLRDVPEDDGRW